MISEEFETKLNKLCHTFDVSYQKLIYWLADQPGVSSDISVLTVRGKILQVETTSGERFKLVEKPGKTT